MQVTLYRGSRASQHAGILLASRPEGIAHRTARTATRAEIAMMAMPRATSGVQLQLQESPSTHVMQLQEKLHPLPHSCSSAVRQLDTMWLAQSRPGALEGEGDA